MRTAAERPGRASGPAASAREPAPGTGWVAVIGGVTLLWLLLTFAGLFARVPWARLGEVAVRPEFRDALVLSLQTCLATTAVVFAFGLPFALWMGQSARLAPLLRILVLLPMTLPPVVAGLALLATFGRRGLLGAPLSVLGVEIGFTTVAVVLAQVFVSLPYFVVAVEAAHRVMDPAPGRALGLLGASPSAVLRHATLPALGPAIVSGLSLAFARALGEFGATLTFAGSLQGTTRTMPLAIYLARESDPEISYALALALILTAVVAITTGHGLARLLARPRPAPFHGEMEGLVPRAEPVTVNLTVRRPERGVEADLSIPAGETVALIGPNG
nr:ABC transporter permease subunit [Actinomycetales bacterium]